MTKAFAAAEAVGFLLFFSFDMVSRLLDEGRERFSRSSRGTGILQQRRRLDLDLRRVSQAVRLVLGAL
jgi:hypothetical protein